MEEHIHLISEIVDEKLKSSLTEHKNAMLHDLERIVEKISSKTNVTQLTQISNIVSGIPSFKRKSSEEQFKHNAKVNLALEEVESSLSNRNIEETRNKIAEVKAMVAHRQKLIRLADESELGWRFVSEYESNPLASDSEDEKRMYRAEARANKKLKAEKSKKSRGARNGPYRKPMVAQNNATQGMSMRQPLRRPGLCFACGKPGHWKGAAECPASSSNNKISSFMFGTPLSIKWVVPIPSEKGIVLKHVNTEIDLKDPIKEIDTGSSPVSRLKAHVAKWQEATDSKYILDVVSGGYKIPLITVPKHSQMKNNYSARVNSVFVESEIKALLDKGIVSRCNEIPHIVNPLTVAFNKKGKPRLVLDCRYINPHLHQFKVKFEDIKVAETLFEKNSFLFTFDIKGAYHHIDIFMEHRKYLGFSYQDNSKQCYYVFNSLPFGIKTAGHIFTKLLRVVVALLRSKGLKIVMFLDDGIGGNVVYERALCASEFTRNTLVDFGFLLAELDSFSESRMARACARYAYKSVVHY
ncbi:uncharacterized protein LOC127849815 [Dreissena polymorpha]|uniref:uncharacterized protein LOC127849815 n=1 Tax=Dreissena polymorpha TaxID=45954 RepID=UPI002263E900|nr:uncharacterized protein LOC127849815 [Dreissena polymorpha]